MEQIIPKEELERLEKIKGKIRGLLIKAEMRFIIKEGGEESLKKIEEEMGRLGYSFKCNDVRIMKFYPIGLRTAFLLVTKQVLGFSDDKIREMGSETPKFSPIIRFFMPVFSLDMERFFERVPSLWKKFCTIGRIVIPLVDEENRKIIGQLRNFKVHPIYGPYLEGTFGALVKMATGAKESVCKETKSPFRGDDYHEFVISWQ